MQKPMSDRLPSRLKKYTQYYAGVQPACWLFVFLHGLDSLLISICYFLPLYFVQQLHFSVTTSGFTIAFYSLGTMAGSVMGGYGRPLFSASYCRNQPARAGNCLFLSVNAALSLHVHGCVIFSWRRHLQFYHREFSLGICVMPD
ncbi:hypothetical protein AQUSIP_04820 [Aquicella siphonis]|uniref:Major facilitator superfamily (MFS) profile domain-containing protein n=1 Tax=Aquicella siphonis TaxID=254247 RepID=A0A5E4PF04_9COXI|nr:hypothetical protein AQUSIP_04820 [Aquicella siphonis]